MQGIFLMVTATLRVMKSVKLLFLLSFILAVASCHKSTTITPAPTPTPSNPDIGVGAAQQHAYRVTPASGSIITDPAITQASGSLLLSIVGRGTWSVSPNAPTDNHGNTFTLTNQTHTYHDWPNSETGLYIKIGAAGGANHTFSATFGSVGSQSTDGDEVSLSVVEVLHGTKIQGYSFVEKTLSGSSTTLTSNSVTTTGPAVLVAWWWGTAGIPPLGQNHTAIPGNGFTLIAEASRTARLNSNGYVQFAAAYKVVSTPGTYSMTWTTTEGAQLYLVAVQ